MLLNTDLLNESWVDSAPSAAKNHPILTITCCTTLPPVRNATKTVDDAIRHSAHEISSY